MLPEAVDPSGRSFPSKKLSSSGQQCPFIFALRLEGFALKVNQQKGVPLLSPGSGVSLCRGTGSSRCGSTCLWPAQSLCRLNCTLFVEVAECPIFVFVFACTCCCSWRDLVFFRWAWSVLVKLTLQRSAFYFQVLLASDRPVGMFVLICFCVCVFSCQRLHLCFALFCLALFPWCQ